jgi:large subunit ribosomal protein L18
MLSSREKQRRRAQRVRNRLRKVGNGKPRLSVSRSSKNISVQLIDDSQSKTLAPASTLEADFKKAGKTAASVDAAAEIGKLLADRAKKAGVTDVVFDRGAFLFHGRIKALADAAREGGLQF